MSNEPKELNATEKAHAWQDFRKWCVEKAIDAKATAMEENVVSMASEIAKYVMKQDELELPPKNEGNKE